MANNMYVSIDFLYGIAKEEYDYQRERLKKIETRVELIMGVVGAVFTFEIANALKVLDIDYSISSFVNFKKFLCKMFLNVPYLLSFLLLIASIILLIYVGVNIKGRVVDVVKLYNGKIYSKPKEDITPYLTALYVKYSAYNFKKINSLYKKINLVILMAIGSMLLFGIAFLW